MNWFRERVQLATKKTTRNVNRDGRRWTEDRAGMILRIPIDLREAIKEEARVAGDLSKVVLFALRHVERKDVTITQTRKAGLRFPSPSSCMSVRGTIRADGNVRDSLTRTALHRPPRKEGLRYNSG